MYPPWTIWLVYLLTVLAASETFLGSFNAPNRSQVHFVAASSLAWALSTRASRRHEESGVMQANIAGTMQSEQAGTVQSSLTYSQWLRVCIAANAVPALAHMCAGISIAVVTALATKSNSIWWRRWIILVRFFLNLCRRTT
jgi:succinate dehydrogenase/fumarate reductase cytochrome b subunit